MLPGEEATIEGVLVPLGVVQIGRLSTTPGEVREGLSFEMPGTIMRAASFV